VLTTAGIENPQAFVVTYSDGDMAVTAVERLRLAYPSGLYIDVGRVEIYFWGDMFHIFYIL
jgi:hypothetical protein